MSYSAEDMVAGITNEGLKTTLLAVHARDPAQPEFLQAVKEVATSLEVVFDKKPDLLPVFAQLCEPERQIVFRVPWLDDTNTIQVNRGMRVQVNSAIGPYKGGLRFHPTVTLSIIKFLGFEQTFKNALTTLPMGGGKGGADFDPKGKSDGEIMRFCQSFMTELHKHIGYVTDVPAGDIGVGGKEIGYLYGQYKRLTGCVTGVLTGKGMTFGGSYFRPEATGYGCVFLAEEVLADKGDSIAGKACLLSGSGNVATFCAELLISLGAKVLTLSDSKGCIYEKDGLTKEQLVQIMDIKSSHDGSLADYKSDTVAYHGDRKKPWQLGLTAEMVFPCATQNEVDGADAEALIAGGAKYVFEGANMPCNDKAVHTFLAGNVLYAPGKMANAGGVAVSGLEMSQNKMQAQWSREEVSDKLRVIMKDIFKSSKAAAEEYSTDFGSGGNISGFLKVADAMVAQGCV